MDYKEVVQYLEGLVIMPKTMPGLEKIRQAVTEKEWFLNLNPQKIITIAGTNGKGTTAAALEALLLKAGLKIGLYTSPHLVNTTERIRINGLNIQEPQFVDLFLKNKNLIEKYNLSHFESLTLMASDIFFSNYWNQEPLNYFIFEVGLGGLYDATNIFPNHWAVVTKLGLDHQNILGNNLKEIAKNKFGIIKNNSVVIHHSLPDELSEFIQHTQEKTKSFWIQAEQWLPKFHQEEWFGEYKNCSFKTNLVGSRAIENIATAITIFKKLGYDFERNKSALENINWPGRMQKISWPGLPIPIYLSGDHNIQGIESFVDIIKNYKYKTLHTILGIGVDKDCDEMLNKILQLPNVKLYLTETPFKGRLVCEYPQFAKRVAVKSDPSVENILNSLEINHQDMIVVTGSLYLVGKILSKIKEVKI